MRLFSQIPFPASLFFMLKCPVNHAYMHLSPKYTYIYTGTPNEFKEQRELTTQVGLKPLFSRVYE